MHHWSWCKENYVYHKRQYTVCIYCKIVINLLIVEKRKLINGLICK